MKILNASYKFDGCTLQIERSGLNASGRYVIARVVNDIRTPNVDAACVQSVAYESGFDSMNVRRLADAIYRSRGCTSSELRAISEVLNAFSS